MRGHTDTALERAHRSSSLINHPPERTEISRSGLLAILSRSSMQHREHTQQLEKELRTNATEYTRP